MRAFSLISATIRNFRLNLFHAFACNGAAGALYPAFCVLLGPIWAGAAMSLSSLSVIGNALRLRGARL